MAEQYNRMLVLPVQPHGRFSKFGGLPSFDFDVRGACWENRNPLTLNNFVTFKPAGCLCSGGFGNLQVGMMPRNFPAEEMADKAKVVFPLQG